MKPTTILFTALATLAAAAPAPAEKKVEERSFNFNINDFNNFQGVQSTNLAYVLNLNGIDFNILQLLAGQNFNINPFASLFQLGVDQFDIQSLLLAQQFADLQAIAQLGVLNNINLSGFQFGGFGGVGHSLNLGLLNLGGLQLNSFVPTNVISQVQTVAQSFLVPAVLRSGISGLNSGFSSGFSSPVVSSGLSSGLSSGVSSGVGVSSAPSSGAVTAAEFEAQEGGSSLNRA